MDSTSDVRLEPVLRMYCPVCEQKMDTSSAKALSEGRCPSCGEKILIEGKMGDYRVLRQLGQGGMGAVYEGFDEGLGRKVAIKVTLLDVTQDPEMMQSFKREAQVVARLNHPNIVQVYAFGEEKGHPYLIMELLPSGSLMDLLNRDEPISESFLMGVAYEIAEGLNAAQEAGLLHGDIKPENILFDDKMRAKLVDFGIAAMQVSKNSYEVWGTPFYIAPEKVLERKSNHKCDIYSLGATLYHALAGHPPFDGDDPNLVIRAAIDGKAKPLAKFRPDISPEIEAIISRMMEKDTAVRYPNYKSLMSDIKKYLATVPHQRLRRTSHILTGGVKKIRPSTRKIVAPNKSSVPLATGSVPVQTSKPPPASKLASKTGFLLMGLTALLLLLLTGVVLCRQNCRREQQKALASQAWALDQQYCKAFRLMADGLTCVETLTMQAQKIIRTELEKLEAQKTKDAVNLKLSEELNAYQKRAQALFNEAVVIRNHAELAKLDPLPQEAVDARYVSELKCGMVKQSEYTQAMMAKGEEARVLLAELTDRLAAQAQVAAPPSPPKLLKELVRGSGRDLTPVNFKTMKELHGFRMEEKDLLILAVWNSQPEFAGGAEVGTLKVTRKRGDKVLKFGSVRMAQSLMGLSTLSEFPLLEAIKHVQGGAKSNEWVVAGMPMIKFRTPSDKDVVNYQVAATPQSEDGKMRLYAAAFVFEAKMRGSYSLDGEMTLQASSATAQISWMVWVARRE